MLREPNLRIRPLTGCSRTGDRAHSLRKGFGNRICPENSAITTYAKSRHRPVRPFIFRPMEISARKWLPLSRSSSARTEFHSAPPSGQRNTGRSFRGYRGPIPIFHPPSRRTPRCTTEFPSPEEISDDAAPITAQPRTEAPSETPCIGRSDAPVFRTRSCTERKTGGYRVLRKTHDRAVRVARRHTTPWGATIFT